MTIDSEHKVYFDEKAHLLICQYGSLLSGEITAEIYTQAQLMVHEIGLDPIQGVVFDFRQVKRQLKGNMVTAQSMSHRVNRRVDLSEIPVALIVSTPLQRAIVQSTLQASPDKHRKKIVESFEEAEAFITEWRKNNLTSQI